MVESRPQKTANQDAFLKRVLVVVVLLPIGLGVIYLGSWVYLIFIAAMLSIAAREFVQLFQAVKLEPAVWLAVGATAAIAVGRWVLGIEGSAAILTLAALAGLSYHLICYERGRDRAASDFTVSLAAVLYIGWVGSYMISLRALPDGMWWVLTVLPAVWLADTAAYMVGVRIGKHKITTRLSPKKSWEGYLAGVAVAIPGTMLLTMLFRSMGASEAMTPLHGGLLAAGISVFCILGDLGESMIKRQVGVKDSGDLLPGHGGIFDRIDSWLWAGVIGYYIITLGFY
jgi:phosphatidate cytidylyltransferase